MNYILIMLGAYLSLYSQQPESRLIPRNRVRLDDTVQSYIVEHEWASWKEEHNKTYDDEMIESLKKIIFGSNARAVRDYNLNLAKDHGFELGLNHLADMSQVEMKQLNGYLNEPRPNNNHGEAFLKRILDDPSEVPDEVDWRKVPNRVSGVKNQGNCGSCWAFATTGMLEGQELIHNKSFGSSYANSKEIVLLSEQNLVDCVTKDYGCNGGLMSDALDFIKQEGGIESEADYPYEEVTNKCRFRKDKVAFTEAGYTVLPTGDEEKLKKVVAKYGPVSVAIDAGGIWFQLYRKGVYISKHCSKTNLNHAVLVVGYGTDPKKGDYWIVKNSWGPRWGQNGYILMGRNRKNMCGIATAATIATF